MDLIVVWAFFVTVGLLLASTPLFIAAWRRGRMATIRNFALVATLIGVACGALAAVSNRQVEQCMSSGSSGCIDWGTAGMQLTIIGFYVLAAWLTAYVFHQD